MIGHHQIRILALQHLQCGLRFGRALHEYQRDISAAGAVHGWSDNPDVKPSARINCAVLAQAAAWEA